MTGEIAVQNHSPNRKLLMRIPMNKIILILTLILWSNSGYTQNKFEQDKRIKKKSIPAEAISFVDSIQLSHKVKWYQKTSSHNTTYEAKTKHHNKRYNIVFSKQGKIEHLEIEITTKDISPIASKNITQFLTKTLGKYSYDQVKTQYTNLNALTLRRLINRQPENTPIKQYVIELTTKANGIFVSFAYLFDDSGAFIKKTLIRSAYLDTIAF